MKQQIRYYINTANGKIQHVAVTTGDISEVPMIEETTNTLQPDPVFDIVEEEIETDIQFRGRDIIDSHEASEDRKSVGLKVAADARVKGAIKSRKGIV